MDKTLLQQLIEASGAVTVAVNGGVSRFSFTQEQLEHFVANVGLNVGALFGTGYEVNPRNPISSPAVAFFDPADYVIDPEAVYPLRVQRVTPMSWAVIDARGQPVIVAAGVENVRSEPDPFEAQVDAQAALDAVRWDVEEGSGKNVAPRFLTVETPQPDSLDNSD